MYLSSKQSGNMSSYYEELKVRQKIVWISYSDVGFSEYSKRLVVVEKLNNTSQALKINPFFNFSVYAICTYFFTYCLYSGWLILVLSQLKDTDVRT